VSLPVLTAVTGASWEATLVAALERRPVGVTVVRRCVDLADLLAAAAAGTARAALLSADLRRLDREALSRLAAAGVAVVGLYPPGDDTAERRLRQLGVRHVLPADSTADLVGEAVATAVRAEASGQQSSALLEWGNPAAALPPAPADGAPDAGGDAMEPGSGRLVAVWGPTGAPGRTTVAVAVATEISRLGVSCLLATPMSTAASWRRHSACSTRPRVSPPPRAWPTRGRSTCPRSPGWLQWSTGGCASSPALRERIGGRSCGPVLWRWSGQLARSLASVTVVDCGFSLEQDEELSFDTAAPRRNGATLVTLAEADVVLAVGAADPIGLQRLVRALPDVRDAAPTAELRVVVTRLRRGPVGSHPETQIRHALARYAGVEDNLTFVPYDRSAYDAALAAGRSLGDVAPNSAARAALASLAADLVGQDRAGHRRRWGLRRGA
jgi:hypothetical protein